MSDTPADAGEREPTEEGAAPVAEPDFAEVPGSAGVADAASTATAEAAPSAPNTASGAFSKNPMERFAGVQVVLTAELGRVSLSLQELMNLSEGQVIELNRSISSPVELVAQGVPLGNGEVVVVEDQFAIRIRELYQSSKG